MPFPNNFLYTAPMQIFLSVASLGSHRAEDNVPHPLLFVCLSHCIPTFCTFTHLSPVPMRSIYPPYPFRLVTFWLFISPDFTVPSFSSPRLPLWWEFHPHRGNQIKKQAGCLCQEPLLQRPFGGPCCPTELKLGPFSSSWFYLKEKEQTKQNRSCWEKFPKWNSNLRRQGKEVIF